MGKKTGLCGVKAGLNSTSIADEAWLNVKNSIAWQATLNTLKTTTILVLLLGLSYSITNDNNRMTKTATLTLFLS